MRTPGITEIYDIVSKMNGSFCSVDIFRELICPEWTYWEETRAKGMINKALRNLVKWGTIIPTGDRVRSGYGNNYVMYRRC